MVISALFSATTKAYAVASMLALLWGGAAVLLYAAWSPLGRDATLFGRIGIQPNLDWQTVVRNADAAFGRWLETHLPARLAHSWRMTVVRTGAEGREHEFLGATALMMFVSGVVLGVASGRRGLEAGAAGAIFVLMTVLAILKVRGAARSDRIASDVSIAVELISLALEAGMGFQVALRQACAQLGGPLGEELGRAAYAISFGLPQSEALRLMAERIRQPEISGLVSVVNQTSALGGGMAQAMTAVADRIRMGRMLTAEKRAAEASVKMLLPLTLCIFPSLLVLILGPILVSHGRIFG